MRKRPVLLAAVTAAVGLVAFGTVVAQQPAPALLGLDTDSAADGLCPPSASHGSAASGGLSPIASWLQPSGSIRPSASLDPAHGLGSSPGWRIRCSTAQYGSVVDANGVWRGFFNLAESSDFTDGCASAHQSGFIGFQVRPNAVFASGPADATTVSVCSAAIGIDNTGSTCVADGE